MNRFPAVLDVSGDSRRLGGTTAAGPLPPSIIRSQRSKRVMIDYIIVIVVPTVILGHPRAVSIALEFLINRKLKKNRQHRGGP